jgi:hypothetical protein
VHNLCLGGCLSLIEYTHTWCWLELQGRVNPGYVLQDKMVGIVTVKRFFPTFAAENPYMSAKPAWVLFVFSFLLFEFVFVLIPGVFSPSLLSRPSPDWTVARFARLRSRRSVKPDIRAGQIRLFKVDEQ